MNKRQAIAGVCALALIGTCALAFAGNKWLASDQGTFVDGVGAYTNLANNPRASIASVFLNSTTFTTNNVISVWVTEGSVSNLLAATPVDKGLRGTNTFAYLDGETSVPLNPGERIVFNTDNTNPITFTVHLALE
jgi:hypothetical protein